MQSYATYLSQQYALEQEHIFTEPTINATIKKK